MSFISRSQIKQTSIEARVIRADGSVVDLGTIAFWHRNPIKRWAWAVSRWARGLRGGSITHH